MPSGREDGIEVLVESSRRVYDRALDDLDSVDDKAMRTSRTGVIILGFVAAAITAAGPKAASGVNRIPLIAASIGVILVFSSTFVCIGVYSVTEYPYEIKWVDERPGSAGISAEELKDNMKEASSKDDLRSDRAVRLHDAASLIDDEVDQNAAYLEASQLGLLAGSTFLIVATAAMILRQSFGLSGWEQVAAGGVSLIALGVGIKLITVSAELASG